jgi:hypothetical protein
MGSGINKLILGLGILIFMSGCACMSQGPDVIYYYPSQDYYYRVYEEEDYYYWPWPNGLWINEEYWNASTADGRFEEV